MLAVARAAARRADVAARTLIAVGAYAAVVDSFCHEKEEDVGTEDALERTVALLDNRSRNYGVPQEVAAFYEKGAANDAQQPPEEKSILSWRATEGVRKRNFVRCRGGEAEMHANYEVQGMIGSGAFATVRRAIDRVTGFPRAIKMVRTGQHEGLEQELEWERMLTEVEALMELTHPNIVRLHEYYRDDDALYLVEEFCSGGTLESRLQERGGRLHPDEVGTLRSNHEPGSRAQARAASARVSNGRPTGLIAGPDPAISPSAPSRPPRLAASCRRSAPSIAASNSR